MLSATGVLTDSGDSDPIVSPTGTQFVQVWGLSVMGRDSDIDVVVKTGETDKYTVFCPATGVGGVSHPSGHEPLFAGAAGEALVISLSGAGEVAYNLAYAIKG